MSTRKGHAVQKNGKSPVAYATNDPAMSSVDRRIRRTRTAILSAFEGLAGSMPLDELSVARIAEAADINRVTFYAHFRSIGELVEAASSAVIARSGESMRPAYVDEKALEAVGDNVRSFIAAFAESEKLLSWIYGSAHRERLVSLVRESLGGLIESRMDQVGTACPARRRELFREYTAAGIARLVMGFVTGEIGDGDFEELAAFLPSVWLPSAYRVLGIAG
jgi:AcrR family transcriptional regulator